MEYKYSTIIIGKRDVGETDRIYSLYTLESGKIQALAKGVRKSKAKLAGFLENPTLADITIMRTRGIGKITSSIVEENFGSIKKNETALISALKNLHIFNSLVDLEHKDTAIFDLLFQYLFSLNVIARGKYEDMENKVLILEVGFLAKLLHILGYSIVVNECAHCGKPLLAGKIFFSPAHGGIVCSDCSGLRNNMIKISANIVKLLRIIFQNKIGSLVKLNVEKKEILAAGSLVKSFIKWIR